MLTSNRCDRFALLFSLIGLAAGCGDGTAPAVDGGGLDGAGGDAIASATVCPWGSNFPSLTLPTAEMKGVLKGTSRNASTTCTPDKGTGGPETFFLLPVQQRTTVDIQVTSTIDTVVAIRTVCDDPLSELACTDTQAGSVVTDPMGGGVPTPRPVFPPDAAATEPPPAGGGSAGHLRATLNPGTYYVLVDQAAPYGVGGAFTLKLDSSAPAANASCIAARPVTDGTSLASEELDVAFEKPPACGAEGRSALFYSAKIPSGQRLTVRATPTGGDRNWNTQLQLTGTCTDKICLARDVVTDQGDRVLRYVNNGPDTEDVVLAVAPSVEVSGGTFRLDVSIGEPVQNGTCASARPLVDGQTLRNQDLAEGMVSGNVNCKPSGGNSLFYSARLLPLQGLTVTVTGASQGFMGLPFFLTLHQGCQMDCQMVSQGQINYVNNTGQTQTMVLEVSGLPGIPSTIFDLTASLPLPPGSISVDPSNGLVTTEAGGTSRFEVVLSSPPTSPVMIPIVSSDTTEGTVSPSSLTFTPNNWSQPQAVTVTGVDDTERDGNQQYTILVQPATSADPRYDKMGPEQVQVLNLDDEASFTFVAGLPLETSENGSTASFTVALNKKPTADVKLPLASSNTAEGTVSPAVLTFTPDNWSTPQTVTVTGVDDQAADGPQAYKILIGPAMSADPDYNGLDPDDLAAENADNEYVPIPAHAVNGSLPCFSGDGRRLAVDDAGNVYVALSCLTPGSGFADGGAGFGGGFGGAGGASGAVGGGPFFADAGVAGSGGSVPVPPPPPPGGPALFVLVSHDGGSTFSAPKNVAIGGTGSVWTAAGAGNLAYVLVAGPDQALLERTEDGGQTWTERPFATPGGGDVRLASAGKYVVAAVMADVGPVLWHSSDGGRSFQATSLQDIGVPFQLAARADGTIWLASSPSDNELWKSTDGGATFPTHVSLANEIGIDSMVFGAKNLYAAGPDQRLAVMPLDGSGATSFIDGLSTMPRFPRDIVVDGADNVTVVDSTFMGVDLRRLAAGATSIAQPRALGQSDTTVWAAALSDRAVVALMSQMGQAMVAVQTWP